MPRMLLVEAALSYVSTTANLTLLTNSRVPLQN